MIGRFLLGDEIHPLGYVAMVLTQGRDRTWGGEGGPRGNAPADINRHDGPVGAAPGSRSQKPTWAKATGLARDWKLNRPAERLLLPAERNAV